MVSIIKARSSFGYLHARPGPLQSLDKQGHMISSTALLFHVIWGPDDLDISMQLPQLTVAIPEKALIIPGPEDQEMKRN